MCPVSTRGPSVWLSVTLVHPAKTVGRNEMPFGRNTDVIPSNIVLEGAPVPSWEWEIWGSEPGSKFALQIAAKPLQVAEWLLWTACRNSAKPYPMVPSLTPYDFPFPQITCLQWCRLVPNVYDPCCCRYCYYYYYFITMSNIKILFKVIFNMYDWFTSLTAWLENVMGFWWVLCLKR